MTNKNNRKSLKKESLIEKKLKNKLKSENKKSLKEEEEDDDLDDNTDIDQSDEEPDFDLGDETPSESPEDFDENNEDDEEEFDFDSLDDSQKEWFDDEVDDLLEPAAEELEAEEHADADDLDIETEATDLDSEEDESVFSADELNDLIDSDDTLHDLEHELTDLAQDEVPSDDEDIEDEDEDFEGDDFEDEEGEDLDGEDESDEDLDDEDDDEMLESDLMTEAEIESDLQEAQKRNKAKRRKIKEAQVGKKWAVDDDHLYGKDYQWEKEDGNISDIKKASYSKVNQGSVGHERGIAKTKEGLSSKMRNLKRESVEKSKMLVLAANRIKKLMEANHNLKMQNMKLTKANGILAAVGSQLDTKSRAFVAESFVKCKDEKQVQKLYEKIVKVVKNKSRKSLNETVAARVKPQVSNLLLSAPKDAGKLNEGKNMSFEMKRKMHLMGLETNDDAYYNNY